MHVREQRPLRVGFYYRHLYQEGGYPRDLCRLMTEINRQGRVNIIPITSIRQFWDTRSQLDLVHLFGMFMPDLPVVAAMARLAKLPYVSSSLGALLPYALARRPLKKQLFLKSLGNHYLQRATAIHVFTHNELEAIRGLGVQTPVFKSPLGLYTEDIPSSIPQSSLVESLPPYLLFFGRLEVQQKGLDLMLEGFRKYMKSNGKLHLVICGRDWQGGDAFIRQFLSQVGPQDRIHYLAEVDLEIKYALFKQAKAFVYPTRHDGPPRPIRDALSMKKRILITPQANIDDDIESKGWGYCFNPDADSFAQAIHRFENEEKAPDYLNPLEVLSWEKIAENFTTGYLQLGTSE